MSTDDPDNPMDLPWQVEDSDNLAGAGVRDCLGRRVAYFGIVNSIDGKRLHPFVCINKEQALRRAQYVCDMVNLNE